MLAADSDGFEWVNKIVSFFSVIIIIKARVIVRAAIPI